MSLRQSIETYIHAKDGNRPHLLLSAFATDAELVMEVRTDEISFPTAVRGLDDISAVLVSKFAQRYENIYTVCMGAPPDAATEFRCDWLVCMTEKESGATRVGFGGYTWHCQDGSGKISKLKIIIEEMRSLPSELSQLILEWVQALPYPWCPREMPAHSAPDIPSVQKIARQLAG
ncbi:conserved hypothetical protein [Burkholderia sp. H160]|nr:conserved hypothetical protein [Burkholderia sp. H160]